MGRNPETSEATAPNALKRVNLIKLLVRGSHQGQRPCAARKGRTYDRTVPMYEID